MQLTRIYSASGALEKDGQAVTRRPMRSIHHTASKQSIVGGGTGVPRPGEITMASLGRARVEATIDANTLSTRSMDRLAKVARTAADLAESETTEPEHMDAAARFVIGGTLRENF